MFSLQGENVVTFEDIKNNETVKTYIRQADESLKAIGYTEHSFAHAGIAANNVGYILKTLGYSDRYIDVAKIAAYLHDIGNLINRIEHSQSGAIMAFRILSELGMDPEEISTIITAIGNHDEGTGVPVNAASAALILADKSDVRRSRVREGNIPAFDIHDRVNYSVASSKLTVDAEKKEVYLSLVIETEYSSVMEYFEIFLDRMLLCRKAATSLGLDFHFEVNGQTLL